jgi:prolyl oligopeptidase
MAKKFEEAGLPFLYYENIDGGHSAAANQTERAKRTALEFSYLRDRLFPESQ